MATIDGDGDSNINNDNYNNGDDCNEIKRAIFRKSENSLKSTVFKLSKIFKNVFDDIDTIKSSASKSTSSFTPSTITLIIITRSY